MPSKDILYRYILHGTRLSIQQTATPLLTSINLNTPTHWPDFNSGTILSKGTTTCIRTTLPSIRSIVYFKRYNHTKNPWEFFLRRSKAANEYINYQRFKSLGIPTLNTLALYEQRSLGRLKYACIVTEEVPNTMQLDDFYINVLLNLPIKEQQRILVNIKTILFQQIRLAHDSGVFHLDLKWRNILIQQTNNQYTPVWIDSPRGIQRKFFNYRLKVADLSGLARKALSFFTAQQLYRMVYCYLGQSASKTEARKLFFDISKHLSRRPPKKMTH